MTLPLLWRWQRLQCSRQSYLQLPSLWWLYRSRLERGPQYEPQLSGFPPARQVPLELRCCCSRELPTRRQQDLLSLFDHNYSVRSKSLTGQFTPGKKENELWIMSRLSEVDWALARSRSSLFWVTKAIASALVVTVGSLATVWLRQYMITAKLISRYSRITSRWSPVSASVAMIRSFASLTRAVICSKTRSSFAWSSAATVAFAVRWQYIRQCVLLVDGEKQPVSTYVQNQ